MFGLVTRPFLSFIIFIEGSQTEGLTQPASIRYQYCVTVGSYIFGMVLEYAIGLVLLTTRYKGLDPLSVISVHHDGSV